MLFLRPYVIRDADDARPLTVQRYDMMRRLGEETVQPPHFALPSFEGPILPELDLGQGAAPDAAPVQAPPPSQ